MNDSIEEEITLARVKMLLDMPFFGQLATRLLMVNASSWCKSISTDGRHLYYNRDFIKSLSRPQTLFVIAHTVLHLVYDHLGRRGNRDPKILDMAQDYVVNYTLVQEKIGELLDGALYDTKYSDEYTSEEIYEILKKNSVEIKMPFDMHLDLGGSGNEDGEGSVSVTVIGEDGPPSLSQADLDQIRADLKAEIIRAAQTAGADKVPAGIRRMIDNLLQPKLDWRTLIDTHLRSAMRDDYSFQTISRRSWSTGMLLPSQDFLEIVEVDVFIDGSGSTTQEMITDFCSEVKGIMEQFRSFRIRVATFDAEIYDVKIFTPENLDEIHDYARNFRGGGGTIFEEIFEYLKREEIEPHRLVILTDGEPNAGWGDPDYCDTLFVIHSNPHKVAPFGISVPYEK